MDSTNMKVSLVSPPTSVADRYPKNHPLRKGVQVTEPLGLGYLASMIEDLADVQIVDCIAENLSTWDCVKRVADSDVIGISAVTSNIKVALKLADQIKTQTPLKTIIFGGIHPSLCPSETLQSGVVDVVIIGEGEHTLRNIMTNKRFSQIKGIAYLHGGKIRINQPDHLEKDLDKFPFPARQLLPMEKYHPFLYLRKPVHSLISSRGCPFTCTYCCRDISGKRYRVRTVEKVIEEIKILVNQYGAKEIAFQDPVFGLDGKWLAKFCILLQDAKLDVIWSALTRVNLVNENILKLMKKSGCWMIYYGIEAGNQQLLDSIKKLTNLEMIRKAVKRTNKAGIKSWGSFMFALPDETPELARETLEFAKSLPLDFASFHLTTPFLGTELRENFEKWGRMNDEQTDFTQLNPVFIPSGWEGKEEELKQFFVNAFKEFYLRPKYALRQLFRIRSLNELKMYYRGLKVV